MNADESDREEYFSRLGATYKKAEHLAGEWESVSAFLDASFEEKLLAVVGARQAERIADRYGTFEQMRDYGGFPSFIKLDGVGRTSASDVDRSYIRRSISLTPRDVLSADQLAEKMGFVTEPEPTADEGREAATEQTTLTDGGRHLRFSTHPLDDHFIIRSDAGDEWVFGVEDGVAQLASRYVDGEYVLDPDDTAPADVVEKALSKPHVRHVEGHGDDRQTMLTDGGECLECGETWAENPARKVECPTCGAGVGSPCRRPSGWTCSPHAARYEAAVPVICPLDDCLAVDNEAEQTTLTDGGQTADGTVCPTCGRDDFKNPHGMHIHHTVAHGESLTRETAVCEHCGDEFEVRPGSTGTYCSNECNAAAFRDRVEIECAHCGESFEALPSEVRAGKKYCSQDCYAASMRDRDEYVCEACGRDYSVYNSAGIRYCSRACMAEDRTSKPRPDDLDGLLWVLYVYEDHTARETWLRANANTDEWLRKTDVEERLRENSWMAGGGRPKYGDVTLEDVGLDDPPDDGDATWEKYYKPGAGTDRSPEQVRDTT